MNRVTLLPGLILATVFVAQAQSKTEEFSTRETQTAQTSEKVPTMDGGAGTCSLELTVMGSNGKPVYAATVKVHIAYGFAGARKLDLEAGTNSDGKVKFTGLPARVHRPPLEFDATKDDLTGTATYDPSAECQAKHDITLAKAKAQESH